MGIDSFIYQTSPQRIIFGTGTLTRLPEEADRLGLKRVLILSTPGHKGQAEEVARLLGSACDSVFTEARMHTPVEVTDRAMKIVRERVIDGTVAIGGGSTTGLGKAIAFRSDLPQLVVPTTYAGSELTNIMGETAAGAKKTTRDPKILPEVVIYDVDLTLTLPPTLSTTSAMNAMAHAVEGLYAKDGNPILSLMAEEGIRAIATALPQIRANATDREARTGALYGTWLCGTVLGGTTMALHHKLCHVLGGSFELPHAETHAIILPHAVAYNATAAFEAMNRIARALGSDNAAQGLFDLEQEAGGPTALRDIGMPATGLDLAADLALANPYWNPRPVERAGVRALLDDAWHGRRPYVD